MNASKPELEKERERLLKVLEKHVHSAPVRIRIMRDYFRD